MFSYDLTVPKSKLKLDGPFFNITIYSDDGGALLALPGENPYFPPVIRLYAVPREVEETTITGAPLYPARHELGGEFASVPGPDIPPEAVIRFNVFQANATFFKVGPIGPS